MATRIIKDQKLDSLRVSNTLILPTGQSLIPGSISYNSSENSVNVSDGTSLFSLMKTSAPGSVVIYRPGSTQNNNGVYGDWSQAVTALSKIETPKYLYFDDSIEGTGSITIPTGVWDMTGVIWVRNIAGFIQTGSPAASALTINVSDGAILNGLLGIDGPLNILYNANQPAITIDASSQFNYSGFFLKNYANVICSGTREFVLINTGLVVVTMGSMASIGDTTHPVFGISTGAVLDLNLASASTVLIRSIYGGGNLNVRIKSSDVDLSLPVQNNFPVIFGTITVYRTGEFGFRIKKLIDPAVTDDISHGFAAGDVWANTFSGNAFICANDTAGAAVWKGPL